MFKGRILTAGEKLPLTIHTLKQKFEVLYRDLCF